MGLELNEFREDPEMYQRAVITSFLKLKRQLYSEGNFSSFQMSNCKMRAIFPEAVGKVTHLSASSVV